MQISPAGKGPAVLRAVLLAGSAVLLAFAVLVAAGRLSSAADSSAPLPPVAGDVDCDGRLTIGDAVKIARALVGLPVQQAPGCPLIGAYAEPPGPVDEMASVSTGKASYAVGETVEVTVGVRNESEKTILLGYGNSQRFDSLITDFDLRRIWLWSFGKGFQDEFSTVELEPGEVLEFTTEWPQETDSGSEVKAGTYLIFGFSPHCDSRWPDEGTCRVWAPEPAEIVIE